MYERYGHGDALSREPLLIARNLVRACIPLGLFGALFGGAKRRCAFVVGSALYYSIPLRRAHRKRLSKTETALIPAAVAVKDFAKAFGCLRVLLGPHKANRSGSAKVAG